MSCHFHLSLLYQRLPCLLYSSLQQFVSTVVSDEATPTDRVKDMYLTSDDELMCGYGDKDQSVAQQSRRNWRQLIFLLSCWPHDLLINIECWTSWSLWVISCHEMLQISLSCRSFHVFPVAFHNKRTETRFNLQPLRIPLQDVYQLAFRLLHVPFRMMAAGLRFQNPWLFSLIHWLGESNSLQNPLFLLVGSQQVHVTNGRNQEIQKW